MLRYSISLLLVIYNLQPLVLDATGLWLFVLLALPPVKGFSIAGKVQFKRKQVSESGCQSGGLGRGTGKHRARIAQGSHTTLLCRRLVCIMLAHNV